VLGGRGTDVLDERHRQVPQPHVEVLAGPRQRLERPVASTPVAPITRPLACSITRRYCVIWTICSASSSSPEQYSTSASECVSSGSCLSSSSIVRLSGSRSR
jgi:hypothetical protein